LTAFARMAAVPVAAVTFAFLAGWVIFAASVARFATPMPTAIPQRDFANAPAALVDPTAPTDGIVVLTGGEHRVLEGLQLFERSRARRILISGVHPQTTREDIKRRAKIPQALFSCCVDVGYKALDTSGNAIETADWAAAWGFKRIMVVTSNYHMPRGLLELSRALPGTELVPHPVRSSTYGSGHWWTSASAIRIVTIEYVKSLPVMAKFGMVWASNRLADATTSTRRPDPKPYAAIAIRP
jgi:uncharacterized SAM-binding protein YcdF (DUF218 family)